MIVNKSRSALVSSDSFCENLEVGKWLSSTEAARFLRITPNALRIMVCRAKVKNRKLGSRLRFHIDDLRGLLRKGV